MVVVAIILIGIVVLLLVGYIKFFKFLSTKINKLTAVLFTCGLVIWLSYSTYFAIYPDDSFYADEYLKVTSDKLPLSANFLYKTSSYPDFHGDYGSAALIKLSQKDYMEIKSKLLKDSRFVKESDFTHSEEIDTAMSIAKNIRIVTGLKRKDVRFDKCYYIGFFDDNQTIVINIEET